MDVPRILELMRSHAELIRHTVEAVAPEEAGWRPPSGGWSVLEIVNHLVDEEREDFRARLDLLLHEPGTEWPPIAPESWVTERAYSERDLPESLGYFLDERQRSLEWLASLEDPEWQRRYEHPLGPISAGDLLASWCAHDVLHLRQLMLRRFQLAARLTEPYRSDYAGSW